MIKQKTGWFQPQIQNKTITAKFHYWGGGKDNYAICYFACHNKPQKKYYKLHEVDREKICPPCFSIYNSEYLLSKAEKLLKKPTKILQKRKCAEPGCNVKGSAYVPSDNTEEKAHYCLEHNLRIRMIMEEVLSQK